jgi:ParB/RepB/Spo0J family partition protein
LSAAIAEVPLAKKSLAPPAMPPVELTNSASQNIPISLVLRSPFNRKPEVSDDFVANIRQFGVLQPVLVRPVELGLDRINELPQSAHVEIGSTVYELVAGERRWLASKKNGLPSIPAVIRSLTNVQVMEIQIAENDQREDYSFMDRSEAYARLRNEYMLAHKNEKGWTEEKCMDLIASNCQNDKIKGRTVQQIIALRKLTLDCQAALRKGEMDPSHGYELCRRPPEDQAELLLWLRQQTHHSQGDIPSVRRLKLEIRRMDELREAEKRRQPLFTPPQPGTSTTRVPTVAEVAQTSAARGGVPDETKQLIHRLHTNMLTPEDEKKIQPPKPPTQAQLKKQAEAEAKEQERRRKAERQAMRNDRIDRKAQGLLFAAFASKLRINSSFLTHAVPDLLFSSIDNNVYEGFQVDPAFGQHTLGWPAPLDGNEYSVEEICDLTKKHTRKFTPGVLAAIIATIHMTPRASQKMAKYFGIDAKKLRKQAEDSIQEQERLARKPKVRLGANLQKQLFASLHCYEGAHARWLHLRMKGGATDELLLKQIQREMGTGGKGGKWGNVCFKKSIPAVWFNTVGPTGKPSLQGAELVAAVRDLLKIPEKGDVDA